MLRRAAIPTVACVALLAVLTGCASSSGPSTPGTPPASAVTPSQPTPGAVGVTVTITDGAVTPAPANVDVALGQTVVLTVTSDTADELHVHGYDLEKELPAGQPVTIQFTADQAGTFEVETHESELLLLKLVVS